MRIRCSLLTLIVLAAACGDASDEAGEASADSASAAPAAAADSSPPPTDSAGGWQLSETGIGRLRVGMSAEEAGTALGAAFAGDGTAEPGVEDACEYARSAALPPGVMVMLVGGRVARVEVDSGATASAAGVRIGDAEARVRELYRGRELRVQPHKYEAGRYLIVLPQSPLDTLHRIVFETDSAGIVKRFRGGVTPPVEYVEGCS
ncbi:MAG TPA: hypothetical protein VFR81_22340 [Longimicrobium sp.]|nr:hypothetical protein [Longimicrobium sp.]